MPVIWLLAAGAVAFIAFQKKPAKGTAGTGNTTDQTIKRESAPLPPGIESNDGSIDTLAYLKAAEGYQETGLGVLSRPPGTADALHPQNFVPLVQNYVEVQGAAEAEGLGDGGFTNTGGFTS